MPTGRIDADVSIIPTDGGTMVTVLAENAGVIGISVSVIDFDPNPGVPMNNIVA